MVAVGGVPISINYVTSTQKNIIQATFTTRACGSTTHCCRFCYRRFCYHHRQTNSTLPCFSDNNQWGLCNGDIASLCIRHVCSLQLLLQIDDIEDNDGLQQQKNGESNVAAKGHGQDRPAGRQIYYNEGDKQCGFILLGVSESAGNKQQQ